MGDGHEQQHEEQCHVMGREGRGGGALIYLLIVAALIGHWRSIRRSMGQLKQQKSREIP